MQTRQVLAAGLDGDCKRGYFILNFVTGLGATVPALALLISCQKGHLFVDMYTTRHNLLATLCLIGVFFCSGASALLFETLWFRLAGLTFGNSVWASALVLSSFMAGLALGNGLLARYPGSITHPLRAYAFLEIFVAVTGVSLVVGLPVLSGWAAPLFRHFADQTWLLNALRCSLAFLLLMAPATSMGMTLPLLVKALYARTPHFGQVLGRLYGWNTLGAVVGALLGEAFFIEWFGMRGTGYLAGAINLGAACGALLVAERVGAPPRAAALSAETPPPLRLDPAAWRFLLAAFLAGAALLALEVVWFRFLRLFNQSTYMAFAIMLAVVLAGIGLGGVLAAALLKRRPDFKSLASWSSLGAGMFLVLGYACFSLLIRRYESEDYLVTAWADMFFLSGFLMFPVSLCSGALFTSLGQNLHARVSDATRAAGLLALSNTLGAMLGPLVAGFVLLPWLGMERSFFLFAFIYGLIALCSAHPGNAAQSSRLAPRWRLVALFVVVLALFPFGLMRAYLELAASKHDRYGFRQIAVREGVVDTIQYLRKDFLGKPYDYQLLTNGFSMSGTGLFAKRYMNDYVYFARALRPDMQDCLLICFGVGNTAKAMTDDRAFKRIDIVDISPDVLEMSKIVFDPAANPLNDSRVRVHIEDGRFFLQTTERRFDLITAEPPPLIAAGTVNLYTQEYFQLLYERLREGGVVTYWLPVHQITEPETRAILKAFCNAFPNASLWAGKSLDWMLVGVRGELQPASDEAFSRQWEEPVTGAMLRKLGFEAPSLLLTTFLSGPETLRALTRDVEPLVDNHPKRLLDRERSLSDSIAKYLEFEDSAKAAERFRATPSLAKWFAPLLLLEAAELFFVQEIVNKFFLLGGFSSPPFDALHAVLTKTNLHTLALWLQNSDARKLELAASALPETAADFTLAQYHLGAGALAARNYAAAAAHFHQSRGAQGVALFTSVSLQTYALLLAGEGSEAATVFRSAAADLTAHEVAANDSFRKWALFVFNVAL